MRNGNINFNDVNNIIDNHKSSEGESMLNTDHFFNIIEKLSGQEVNHDLSKSSDENGIQINSFTLKNRDFALINLDAHWFLYDENSNTIYNSKKGLSGSGVLDTPFDYNDKLTHAKNKIKSVYHKTNNPEVTNLSIQDDLDNQNKNACLLICANTLFCLIAGNHIDSGEIDIHQVLKDKITQIERSLIEAALQNLNNTSEKDKAEKIILGHIKGLKGEKKIELINKIQSNNINHGESVHKNFEAEGVNLIYHNGESVSKLKSLGEAYTWNVSKGKDPIPQHKTKIINEKFCSLVGTMEQVGNPKRNGREKTRIVDSNESDRKTVKIGNKTYTSNNELFSWHHIIPKSRLDREDMKNLNMIRLGPLPELRLDDPNDKTIDPNLTESGRVTPVSSEIVDQLLKKAHVDAQGPISFKLGNIKNDKTESPENWYLIPSKLGPDLERKIAESFEDKIGTRKGMITHVEYIEDKKDTKGKIKYYVRSIEKNHGIAWSELTKENLGDKLFLELNDKLTNKDKATKNWIRCFTRGGLQMTFEAEIKQEFVNAKAEIALERFYKMIEDNENKLNLDARKDAILKQPEILKEKKSNELNAYVNFLSDTKLCSRQGEYSFLRPKEYDIEQEKCMEKVLSIYNKNCKVEYCDDYKNLPRFEKCKKNLLNQEFKIVEVPNIQNQLQLLIVDNEDNAYEKEYFEEFNSPIKISLVEDNHYKMGKVKKGNSKKKQNNEKTATVKYNNDVLEVIIGDEGVELTENGFNHIKETILREIEKHKNDDIEDMIESNELNKYNQAVRMAKNISNLDDEYNEALKTANNILNSNIFIQGVKTTLFDKKNNSSFSESSFIGEIKTFYNTKFGKEITKEEEDQFFYEQMLKYYLNNNNKRGSGR